MGFFERQYPHLQVARVGGKPALIAHSASAEDLEELGARSETFGPAYTAGGQVAAGPGEYLLLPPLPCIPVADRWCHVDERGSRVPKGTEGAKYRAQIMIAVPSPKGGEHLIVIGSRGKGAVDLQDESRQIGSGGALVPVIRRYQAPGSTAWKETIGYRLAARAEARAALGEQADAAVRALIDLQKRVKAIQRVAEVRTWEAAWRTSPASVAGASGQSYEEQVQAAGGADDCPF